MFDREGHGFIKVPGSSFFKAQVSFILTLDIEFTAVFLFSLLSFFLSDPVTGLCNFWVEKGVF